MRLPVLAGLLGLVVFTPRAHAESFVDLPASAEPPAASVQLGDLGDPQATLDALAVTLERHGDRVRAELRFRVTTTGLGHREEVLPIAVPHGAEVHTLIVDTGDGPSRAHAMPAELAREAYRSYLMPQRDPGLLELRGRDDQADRLRLHLFPITRGAGARVTLVMELPRTEQLEIDPGPNALASIALTIDGKAARRANRSPRQPLVIALGALGPEATRHDWIGEPVVSAAHVDMDTSLFAGPPPRRPGAMPTVTFGAMPRRDPESLDGRAVRRVVKLHSAQLAECFNHEAQFGHPTLAGTVVLRFLIAPDGKVKSVATDTQEIDDQAVMRCLEHEVAGWEFASTASQTSIQVSYPICFKGAR